MNFRSVLSGLFMFKHYAKYRLSAWTPICGKFCVRNLFYDKVASEQVKGEFRYVNSLSTTYDKWPSTRRIEIARAFQRLRYTRLLKTAVRGGHELKRLNSDIDESLVTQFFPQVGVPYPEHNLQLATLIEEIKRHDLDISTEQVIKRALNPKARSGIYEVGAPGGILLIIQHDSLDISLTNHLVRELCAKYDFTFLGLQSRQLTFYDQKGILTALLKSRIPLEEALDIVTKAGAKSNVTRNDVEEKIFLEIYCSPSNLHKVKRELENSFIIEEAFVGYVAKSLAKVSDSMKSVVADAIIDLSKIAEIEMIYQNVK